MKFCATGKFDLACSVCDFKLTDVDAGMSDRVRERHEKEKGGHAIMSTERLPRQPMVGDRVKIRENLRDEFARVYGGQVTRRHVVEKVVNDSKAYGEPMLFLDAPKDGPRIMIRPKQVELAWKSEAERRVGLEAYAEKTATVPSSAVSWMHGRKPDGSAA